MSESSTQFTKKDQKTLKEMATTFVEEGSKEDEVKTSDSTNADVPIPLNAIAMGDAIRDDIAILEALGPQMSDGVKGSSCVSSKEKQILEEIKSLIEKLRELESQKSSSFLPLWVLTFYTFTGDYRDYEKRVFFAQNREDLESFLEKKKSRQKRKYFRNITFSKINPDDGTFLEITKNSEEHDGGCYYSTTYTFTQSQEKPDFYYVSPIFPSIEKNTKVYSWKEIKETRYWVRPDGTRGSL